MGGELMARSNYEPMGPTALGRSYEGLLRSKEWRLG
jgi:hypothetical protein